MRSPTKSWENRWASLYSAQPCVLMLLIKSIPTTVAPINLSLNRLFDSKSTKGIDEILDILNIYNQSGRLDLSYNVESDYARALGPLTQCVRQGKMVQYVAEKILKYFTPSYLDSKVHGDVEKAKREHEDSSKKIKK